MFTGVNYLNTFSKEDNSDKSFLTGILDYMMHVRRISGYSGVFVPQIGEEQGRPVGIQRYRRRVPNQIKDLVSTEIDKFDVSVPTSRIHQVFETEGWWIRKISISNFYDINIGAVWTVSNRDVSPSEINFIFNFFENLISFRKKAIALSYPLKFLHLEHDSREGLDKSIGEIINDAISPNETIIFDQHKDENNYTISFSSKNTSFRVPKKQGPIGRAFKSTEPVIINNTRDTHTVKRKFGDNFSNPEFLHHNDYRSLVYFPVRSGDFCYCIIACYFGRVNAVSTTERDVIQRFSRILGDYYKLWHDSRSIFEQKMESDKIYQYVKRSLLIADIMHDATEDLVTANGQLGILEGKNDSERAALNAARQSLKEVINAARHFRSTFGGRVDTSVASALSKIQANTFYEEINLRSLVESIGEKYESILTASKIYLRVKVDANFTVRAIRYNIRRAIDNAVKNSLSQLDTKSHVRREITITARKRQASDGEKFISISIYDNGNGIAPYDLNRVREPFVSLRGGMGLGLPIIEAACESHGGRLVLTSEWGESCTLEMLIPENL